MPQWSFLRSSRLSRYFSNSYTLSSYTDSSVHLSNVYQYPTTRKFHWVYTSSIQHHLSLVFCDNWIWQDWPLNNFITNHPNEILPFLENSSLLVALLLSNFISPLMPQWVFFILPVSSVPRSKCSNQLENSYLLKARYHIILLQPFLGERFAIHLTLF